MCKVSHCMPWVLTRGQQHTVHRATGMAPMGGARQTLKTFHTASILTRGRTCSWPSRCTSPGVALESSTIQWTICMPRLLYSEQTTSSPGQLHATCAWRQVRAQTVGFTIHAGAVHSAMDQSCSTYTAWTWHSSDASIPHARLPGAQTFSHASCSASLCSTRRISGRGRGRLAWAAVESGRRQDGGMRRARSGRVLVCGCCRMQGASEDAFCFCE